MLQTSQSRSIGSLLTLILNESFNNGTVTPHFAEQVIEQGCFSQCTREQFLSKMRFPAYLPHDRFNGESELALRSRGWLLIQIDMGKWINKIHTTIGTLQQPVVNVRAAIAAFGFVISGWRSEAGGHKGIVSNNEPSGTRQTRPCAVNGTDSSGDFLREGSE